MVTLVVAIFVLAYLLIVLEHPLKLDKAVPALLGGVLCWAIIFMAELPVLDAEHHINSSKEVLLHHLGEIAQILFFLIGAMVIVELVDLHQGFTVITNQIQTKNKRKLLWLISWMAFFFSAILDNLTTTIVFISLLRKLIPDAKDRIWFASFVVIAANAGGVWTPIGDVTTTMLWIKEKVSTLGLIEHLLLPSLACLGIPLLIAGFLPVFKGKWSEKATEPSDASHAAHRLLSSKTMLIFGVGGLIFVPIVKAVTGLPPYMGMLFSLSVVWMVSEYIHPEENFTEERKQMYSVRHALSRIELSSILFFLGILLAVSSLDAMVVGSHTAEHPIGFLTSVAYALQKAIPQLDIVVIILGLLSAIVDNVPLVAAIMGMFPMNEYPMDAKLWQFIAYAAGTGGSIFIIGSAAGVAAMGMERIDFIWYLKKMSWIALAGYIAGVIVFLIVYQLLLA
ncbi:MAG TPA: sodium:proton antiporter NhaD [Saprospiraceae bacterium]|nr:sodium:proton antiporter NhaD [Saprospiraceae bacterium]HMQ85410.1 sodium:proton antiporter NhaD [Saprospiraceae bacterium]